MSLSSANGSSAMDVQIEPQSQLLSRIQYAMGNESQFSFLSGESGVGKSFIANLLVEDINNTLVIKLSCRENFESELFKQELICQLATDDLSDISQSLTTAIQEATNFYGQSILIIIDNAHHMPRAFVSSLWGSFCEVITDSLTQVTLNILLVGNRGWAKPVVTRLVEIRESLVNDFELAYLTSAQARDFLTAIHPDWSEKKIINQLALLSPEKLTPKALIFFEPETQNGSKLRWGVLLTISLMLSAIAIGWYMLSDAQAPFVNTPAQQAPELIAITKITSEPEPEVAVIDDVIVKPPVSEPEHSPESEQVDDHDNGLESGLVNEQENSIENGLVSAQELSSENDFTSEKTDATETDATESAQVSEQALPLKQGEAQQPALTQVTNSAESAPLVINSNNTAEPAVVVPAPVVSYMFDEKSLLAVPQSHVSLMLGGFSTKAVLNNVIASIKDQSQLSVYKTTRLKQDWFVLLYGDFSNVNAARKVLNSDVTVLAPFSPWIKSFQVINAEISAVAVTVDNNK